MASLMQKIRCLIDATMPKTSLQEAARQREARLARENSQAAQKVSLKESFREAFEHFTQSMQALGMDVSSVNETALGHYA